MDKKEIFIGAINAKKVVQVQIDAKEKGIIERTCIPFDFGPSNKYTDGLNRYHFYSLDSPEGPHNISILPEQLINIVVLASSFQPGDYVHWKPHWYYKRDWGNYS